MMILYGGIMIKERLKKLIAKGILTPQQASQYLRESSHIPLRSWLIDHRYLNEARWKQIFPKEDVALPNSFVLEPQNNTNPPVQANFSVEQQTREQINAGQQNQFRHYKMDKKLGEGGMGKVYKAIDTITNRVVALKFISNQVITHQDHKRFFQEVRAISRLTHDNIIQLYEVGEQPTLYYAMEYIEGKTLKDVHKLSYKQTANILREVAVALDYAHSKNIVHRDIKPDNIILTEKYQAKLTDFGLAKDTEMQNSISRTGSIVGTPAYLSPEQVQGAKVTPQSDIYSVGATLYYVLTGQPPFRDESFVSLFFDILHTIPPAPRRIKADIPKSLENICLKCLEKKPEHRYTTAQQLADDLQNYIDDKPVTAGKSTWRTLTHYMHKLTMRKGLLFLLFCNAFLFALIDKATVQRSDLGELDKKTVSDNTMFMESLIEFSKSKNYNWSTYDRGMLFYQMRQKNRTYKQKAIRIWQKGIEKPKNITDLHQVKYQLFYVEMIDVINGKNLAMEELEELQHECEENINGLKKSINDTPTRAEMLDHYFQFKQILQVIFGVQEALQKEKQQKKEIELFKKRFFNSKKLHSGYGYLFLAHHTEQTLGQQIKYLHHALRMIPREDEVYINLLEAYHEAGFYDEAEALYNYLRENINPHLVNADITMLSVFMSNGQMQQAKQVLDRLIEHKIFNSNKVQLLYCEYYFLLGKNDRCREILQKIRESLSKKEDILRAVIERGLDEKPVGDSAVLIETIRLFILKNNIKLAKTYLKYVENDIESKGNTWAKPQLQRRKANLYRLKLQLYNNEIQSGEASFYYSKFKEIAVHEVAGLKEQFISLINIIHFATQNHVSLDEYMEILQKRCDEHTFFRIYAEYLFRNKRYLDAIGYWENAIHTQPIFHDYLAKKQLKAWELLNGK